MRVDAAPPEWKFLIAIFLLGVAAIALVDQNFMMGSKSSIRQDVYNSLVKKLDLAENSSPKSSYTYYLNVAHRSISNILSGSFPADLDTIKINFKYKHLEQMSKERNLALKRSLLWQPQTYPAEIEFRGRSYRASIRLKGDLWNHWIFLDRWSLRVHLKDGETILGMSRFSLQRPAVRQIPADALFQAWMRAVGNLAPRHEYAHVNFNGDDWGVMNVEEHMTRHLLELNRRREAPLFRTGSEIDWFFRKINTKTDLPPTYFDVPVVNLYGDSRYAEDPLQMALFSYAIQVSRKLYASEIPIEDGIDIDAFSKALIGSAIWQNWHTLTSNNLRFYLNPYTLKIEPVTSDQDYPNRLSSSSTEESWIATVPKLIFEDLVRSESFHKRFGKNLEQIGQALPTLQEELEKICTAFPNDCPGFDFDLIKSNFYQIEERGSDYFQLAAENLMPQQSDLVSSLAHKTLEPRSDITYPQHVYAEYFDSGRLILWNLLAHNVTLERIELVCESGATCEDRTLLEGEFPILAGFDGTFPLQTKLEVPSRLQLSQNVRLEIWTRVGSDKRREVVSLALKDHLLNPFIDLPNVLDREVDLEFVSLNGKDIQIQPGNWELSEPMVVPAGHRLVISPGTTLRFEPDGMILSRSPIIARGTADAPIKLMPKADGRWRGVYVSEAADTSLLRHVYVSGTNALSEGALNLTGAVTFYKSPVRIEHSQFEDSVAEDALNIVQSDFQIFDSQFRDSISDAIDVDYSNGHVSRLTFAYIGGDGLDTSGSDINGESLTFTDIVDKSVSVGERSNVHLTDVDARNVGIGAVSKDGSRLLIDGFRVEHFEVYAGMAFIKKPMYEAAEFTVTGTGLGYEAFFNQFPSSLVVDGVALPGLDLDVDGLYDKRLPLERASQ
jgi:hypothetical protein